MNNWENQGAVNGTEVMFQSISLIHFIGLCWNNDLSLSIEIRVLTGTEMHIHSFYSIDDLSLIPE